MRALILAVTLTATGCAAVGARSAARESGAGATGVATETKPCPDGCLPSRAEEGDAARLEACKARPSDDTGPEFSSSDIDSYTSGSSAPCDRGGMSLRERAAILGSVATCWRDARGPTSAGTLEIKVTDMHVDGTPWWFTVTATVFGHWFLGDSEPDVEIKLRDCVDPSIRELHFKGLDSLEIVVRLLPATPRPAAGD